ncbi:AMP-binding protein [Chelatococcus asaccharovorans]|uniref:Non-ribosomal peptide synthetase component E (Peptide arylation enzyme) n=1 Tax=Chelatococcus asaccharovorans TaxID=28210 RepID=A0A2V3TZL9_9HYPH|nr:AMP-binding protein [Chelatococcus asaccharovorans]MBS7707769.1 AMP-binding protein [Chelatococcus asaccharovorans]PXW55066.1 non-ribosomal peptide synthetase component E (peptide arylation enzyme) [Chelatococcus asaccharovorans]
MQNQVRNPLPGVVYADPERLRRYVEAGALPLESLATAFRRSFARHAARIALYTPEGDVTYAELDEISDRFGAALIGLGIKPQERALFQSGNCRELLFAFIGCLKAGVIPVCTLASHREHEIGYLGCHADARIHIVQGDDPKADLPAFALKMTAEIPTMRHVIVLRGRRDGCLSFDDLLAATDPKAARRTVEAIEHDPFQVCVFQLSGGTTGVPKIIPRMSNDYLLNMLLTAQTLGYTAEDVMFMPMPMIHNACMVCFWGPTLLSGAAFAIPAEMTPEAWGDILRRARPTWLGLIRPLLPRLETMLDRGLATLDRVRAVWSPDAARVFRTKFGLPSHSMFGMTEGVNMYTHLDDPEEVIDWGVGRPMSAFDEVRLVRAGTDEEVEDDEPGELVCRGPYTFAGYYNAPDRNAQCVDAQGFYRSGDLLIRRRIDGETYYAFSGRNKDLVNRGHEKVNAEELETAVVAHPAVLQCAVIGMPDATLGERICVYIVPRERQQAPTVAELGSFLESQGLAKFKWPERVETIEALPVTRVGKLDKAILRADIAAKLGVSVDEPGRGGWRKQA